MIVGFVRLGKEEIYFDFLKPLEKELTRIFLNSPPSNFSFPAQIKKKVIGEAW